jgi:hypothetical protein
MGKKVRERRTRSKSEERGNPCCSLSSSKGAIFRKNPQAQQAAGAGDPSINLRSFAPKDKKGRNKPAFLNPNPSWAINRGVLILSINIYIQKNRKMSLKRPAFLPYRPGDFGRIFHNGPPQYYGPESPQKAFTEI